MVSIALANQKGGVGKTTLTLGLSETAMNLGFNVLVIDCDPQANCTAGLGIEPGSFNYSLADILESEIEIDQSNKSDFVVTSPWMSNNRFIIDVICSNQSLSKVESLLASDPIGSCDRLERAIAGIKSDYDLILFDCPPSIGLLTINALFASDKVVIVSAPSAWSADGVETFAKNVERISSRRSGKPEVVGIVVNNVGRTRDSKFWETELAEKYGDNVVSIRSRAAIAEASAMSVPIKGLGARPGAKESSQEFEEVFLKLIGLVDEEQEIKKAYIDSSSIEAEFIDSAI